jgi:hypothetical protein
MAGWFIEKNSKVKKCDFDKRRSVPALAAMSGRDGFRNETFCRINTRRPLAENVGQILAGGWRGEPEGMQPRKLAKRIGQKSHFRNIAISYQAVTCKRYAK